jgi:acetoin utilization deacetylase AcuC-like enzyme
MTTKGFGYTQFIQLVLIIGLMILVSACAVPQSPAETVFQAKTAHAVALRSAVAYRELPRCDSGQRPCHDPAVVEQLQKADRTADAALDAAEAAVRTPGFGESVIASAVASAKAALTAFVSITDTLRTK